MPERFLFLVACSLFMSVGVDAQGVCATASTKLACVIPQVYGPQGLQYQTSEHDDNPLTSFITQSGFAPPGDVTENLSPVNAGVASQFALVPLVSTDPGLAYTFDKSLGTFIASDYSFGPTLSERASTIGRYRLAIGFNYESVHFDTIDGISLNHFQTIDLHSDIPNFAGAEFDPVRTCSINGRDPGIQNTGTCGIVRDYIQAQNSINLSMKQYTAFLTFGFTSRFDASIAIPVLDVNLAMTTDSTIVPQSKSKGTLFVNPSIRDPQDPSSPLCPNIANDPPELHGPLKQCLDETFHKGNRASGIGDVTVRGKVTVWKGERTALAVGLEVRLPTGDENNFLGTGSNGLKPFAVWSRDGRISPHVNLGYQWNSSSAIAGDLSEGTKGKLPGQFLYSAGADMTLVSRHLTVGVDLIGQRVFDSKRIAVVPVTVLGACSGPALTDENPNGGPTNGTLCFTAGPKKTGLTSVAVKSGSYSIDNALLGLRYRPFGNLLVSASVLLKLDNGGLRSRAIPLFSATYTF